VELEVACLHLESQRRRRLTGIPQRLRLVADRRRQPRHDIAPVHGPRPTVHSPQSTVDCIFIYPDPCASTTPLHLVRFPTASLSTRSISRHSAAFPRVILLTRHSATASGRPSTVTRPCSMAGSVAAVKKDMRRKIRDALRELSDAAVTAQSALRMRLESPSLMDPSFPRHQGAPCHARIQDRKTHQHLPVHAHG
jgi:hypothetical protein